MQPVTRASATSISMLHASHRPTQHDFLKRLELEAERQAKLQHNSVLPEQMEWLARLVAEYSWQSILVLAAVTALSIELARWLV